MTDKLSLIPLDSSMPNSELLENNLLSECKLVIVSIDINYISVITIQYTFA
jgi:hypothetical protein